MFRPARSVLENAANAKINGFEAEVSDRWANGVSAGMTATYTDGYSGTYPGAAASIPTGLGGNLDVSIDATERESSRLPAGPSGHRRATTWLWQLPISRCPQICFIAPASNAAPAVSRQCC